MFVAILARSHEAAAYATAERLRRSLAERLFDVQGAAHITCSIGVAVYPRDATTRETLLKRADAAMYAAKHAGRNQVRMWSESLGGPRDNVGLAEEVGDRLAVLS
jgi:diguanylate cyclase (GGDEF)-like protein